MKGFDPHYLIVSLGNPLPKYASLHSAGHFVLNGLAKRMRLPPFRETSYGRSKCLTSRSTDGKFTLAQSPTLMNVCGSWVASVMRPMVTEHGAQNVSLVIVHDELERDFGDVRLVSWDRSHKGHNGIKSVKGAVSQKLYPESPLVRIAVGIGRPEERDPDTVSNYVLSPIASYHRQALEAEVPWKVQEKLSELEREWREAFEQDG